MKELKSLANAKILSKKEQQSVKGGKISIIIDPCGEGGEILERYTTKEECDGNGIWSSNRCWTCR